METEAAKVDKNEPQPEEQASFNWMESIIPSLMCMAFISWPPISRIKSTSGLKNLAAL